MKFAYLVVGIVVLLMGAGTAVTGYLSGAAQTAVYEACVNALPSPPTGFCDILLAGKAGWNLLMYAGIGIAIVGLILAVYGGLAVEERPALPTGSPAAVPQAMTAPVSAQAPPCPVCGSPLAWIAQYNRWYCGRCAQYR